MRGMDDDGHSANAAKRRRGRTATACIECQRRKKKCDRQWPCNHCQDRRIAHLCDFGVKRAQQRGKATITPPNQSHPEGDTMPATVTTKTAAAAATNTSSAPGHDSVPLPDAASAVHALGYVNSDMFTSVMSPQRSTDNERALELPPPVLQATRALPPRPYTDILVQNFFDKVNYHYGILHQPSFMAAYTTWWSQRRETRYSRSISGVAMACLLLRICANSAQFLSSDAKSQLESDLGDSADSISSLYHAAAEVLSDFLPAGSGGLVNAQQLFLGATWLKAEAEFAKAWHELASCVRQAQEIGIHLDDLPDGMTVFERDLRRRLWCAAYTWDKFMAATFHRPPIIPPGDAVQPPSQSLDSSPTNPEIPSATAAKTLENQLSRHLAQTEPSANSYIEMMTFTEKWMNSLPPVFRINGPDTRWDLECPRLAFQRLQLHSVGYMTQLLLLRPQVMSKADVTSVARLQTERPHSIHRAVDVSLKAMAVSKEFFDLCFPQEAKYFMVSFCPFDNAALLCSLLLHDTGRDNVPRRLEIAAAIGTALHIAHRLRGLTKMSDVTSSILTSLVSHLSFQPMEKEILDEAVRFGEAHAAGVGTGQMEPVGTDRQPPDGIDFNLSDASMTVGDGFQEIDLGILDGLWDWQSLQLGFVGDSLGL